MAHIPEGSQLPTVLPSENVPAPIWRPDVSAEAFGGAVARGTQQFGSALGKIGVQFGQLAADDVANEFISGTEKLLHGDPANTKTGPDGQPIVDTGFLGTKGRATLDAWQDYSKKLDGLYKQARSRLTTIDQVNRFENITRRFRDVTQSQFNGHADRQSLVYGTSVNKGTVDRATAGIVRDPADNDSFNHNMSDIINARTKNAELNGAKPGDEAWLEAQRSGRAHAIKTRAMAIGLDDPVAALKYAEENKTDLGVDYATVYAHLKGPAHALIGQQDARNTIARLNAGPLPTGSFDAKTIQDAIVGDVESGGRHYGADGKILTSSKGALGISQMTQGTFNQYARPGEDINNKDDNLAVSRRAIEDYNRRYNGDWRRVAVAYFSGPGNVAPEGSPVPWKSNSNDGHLTVEQYVAKVGQGLAKRGGAKPDETGGTPAPVLSPEQKHGLAMREILDNPYYRKHPDIQNAALAELNKYYGAERAAHAANTAAFSARLKDSMAEAANTGQVQKPISREEFVANLGEEKGAATYDDYQATIQFGADKKALGAMTPEEITHVMSSTPEPEPGPGYAKALARRHSLLAAAQAVAKARQEDMGRAAIDQLPAVKTAWAMMNQPPDPRTGSVPQAFASISLQEQERVGVPAAQRRILPNDVAKTIVQRIMDSDDAPAAMQHMAAEWGDHWGQIFRELVTDGKLSPMMQAVGGLPPTEAKQLAQWIKGATNAKGEGATTRERGHALAVQALGADKISGTQGIDKQVVGNQDLQRLAHSWRQSGGAAAENWISGMIAAVQNLAYAKAVAAGSIDGAAESAVQAFTSQYEFMPSGARVPANVHTTVSDNSMAVLQAMKPEDLAVPPIYGKPGQAKPEEYVELLRANPHWITNPRSTGLWLMDDGGRLVKTKDGKPFELSFAAPPMRPVMQYEPPESAYLRAHQ